MSKKEAKPAVSSTTTGPPAEFMPYFEKLLTNASDLFDKGQGTTAPKVNVAGFDPAQTQAHGQLLDLANGPMASFAQAILGQSQQAVTELLDPNSATVQNAVTAATNPAIRQFNEQIMPQLEGEAVLSRNVGSSRQGVAQGNAVDALMRNVLDTSASVTNQAYQTGLDTFVNTLALAPQTMGAAMQPALTTAAVGEQRQEQTQRESDADTINQVGDLNFQNQVLSQFANILFGLPMSQSTGTQQAAQGAGGGAKSAIGLGMQGASLGMTVGGPWGAAAGAGLGIISSFF